jgi:hypothetical protein
LPFSEEDIKKWVDSVRPHQNWMVVKRTRLISVCELFDDETQKKIKQSLTSERSSSRKKSFGAYLRIVQPGS